MPPDTVEGTSPPAVESAKSDAIRESDNVSGSQASAALFAKVEKEAKEAEKRQQAATQPAGNAAPPEPTETPDTPAGEAQPASAESTPDESSTDAASPEATKSSEEHDEGDDEDVLSQSNSSQDNDPKYKALIEGFKKRLDKEVRKTKDRERVIAGLEAERQSRQAATDQQQPSQAQGQQQPTPTPLRGAPTGNALLDGAATIEDIEKLEDLAHKAIGDVQDALDNPLLGREPDDTIRLGDGKDWTRQALLELRKSAREVLHLAPKKRQSVQAFENQRTQASNFARQEFTFLKDKAAPEYQQVQVLMRDPWLQQNPNAEWVAAVYVEGLKAIQAKKEAAKAKAEEAAKPKPKPAPPKPSTDQTAVSSAGGSTRVAPDVQARGALTAKRSQFEAKGNVTAKEGAELLKELEQLTRSR